MTRAKNAVSDYTKKSDIGRDYKEENTGKGTSASVNYFIRFAFYPMF